MKFLYSDTQDYVDPNYDFFTDSSPRDRERYWHDQYAHEIMDVAPYDGLLVAMSDLPPPAVPFITRKSGVARLIDLDGR